MNTGVIMIACLVAASASEAKTISNGKGFQMEPIIAAFVLGIFLFTFDAISPTVTKWLTILVIVTVMLTNGQYLLNVLPTNKKG